MSNVSWNSLEFGFVAGIDRARGARGPETLPSGCSQIERPSLAGRKNVQNLCPSGPKFDELVG